MLADFGPNIFHRPLRIQNQPALRFRGRQRQVARTHPVVKRLLFPLHAVPFADVAIPLAPQPVGCGQIQIDGQIRDQPPGGKGVIWRRDAMSRPRP